MNRVETIIAEKMDALKSSGAYRYFLEVNKSAQHFPTFHFTDESGTLRSAVNWCSNDYLCMSTREEVIAKLGFVAHRSGTASSGTRNISGTTNYHRELEQLLAQWHQKEAALVFNGAYQANVTALGALECEIHEVAPAALAPGLAFRNLAIVLDDRDDIALLREPVDGAISGAAIDDDDLIGNVDLAGTHAGNGRLQKRQPVIGAQYH